MSKGSDRQVPDYATRLKPGAKGDISIEAGAFKGRYPTQVEEIKDGAYGFLHPMVQNAFLPVYKGMTMTFTTDDGGALYMFDLAVKRSERGKGLPLMWVEVVGEAKRIQRRNFLRMEADWDIFVFQLESESRTPMAETWKGAKTLDISLRGMRFLMTNAVAGESEFTSGDKLAIKFSLYDHEYYLVGSATRIMHTDDAWEVGMSFDSVALSVEKKLFEYIRQQELMGREDK